MKKIYLLLPFLVTTLLTGCNKEETHQHTFSSEWCSSESLHWHQATCEHKELTSNLSGHTFNEQGLCSVCGYKKETPASFELVVHFTNGKANASDNFKETYALNEYASVKLVANDNYTLPEEIKVTSGNELILPETYTYVLNESKTSADFVIKMNKSYDVVIDAVERFGALYLGTNKITESGDYSDLNGGALIKEGMIVYNKESNTLSFNGAIIKSSKTGTIDFYDSKEGLNLKYLFSYTGSEKLNIELSGENQFIFDDGDYKFLNGGFISINNGEMAFSGVSVNKFTNLGHSLVRSFGKVSFEDTIISCNNAGKYGLFANTLSLDNVSLSITAIAKTETQYEKGCMFGVYSNNFTVSDSGLEMFSFDCGIHATNFKVYNSGITIDANGKGIDVDWLSAIGRPLATGYTTDIYVTAKKGGISSYDTQEWTYCNVEAITESGHGIYTVDTTIRATNSKLSGTTGSAGDGIHAYRIFAVNSKLYGKTGGTFNAGVRSSIYSAQSTDPDKQPFIWLENSIVEAEGEWAAVYGIGNLFCNGIEGYEDANCHYLKTSINKHATIFGLFPLDITECEIQRISSGGTYVTVPVNCAKTCTIDATVTE